MRDFFCIFASCRSYNGTPALFILNSNPNQVCSITHVRLPAPQGRRRGGGLCATPTVWASQALTKPICSERILVRLIWRPGVRKHTDEDLTEERPLLPDCPFKCHCWEDFFFGGGGGFVTRTFGKTERIFSALNREKQTPHSDQRVLKCICLCCLEFWKQNLHHQCPSIIGDDHMLWHGGHLGFFVPVIDQ